MQKGKRALVFLERKSREVSHVLSFTEDSQVGDYYWVNNEIVITKISKFNGKSDPVYYGELYGINADGSKAKY